RHWKSPSVRTASNAGYDQAPDGENGSPGRTDSVRNRNPSWACGRPGYRVRRPPGRMELEKQPSSGRSGYPTGSDFCPDFYPQTGEDGVSGVPGGSGRIQWRKCGSRKWEKTEKEPEGRKKHRGNPEAETESQPRRSGPYQCGQEPEKAGPDHPFPGNRRNPFYAGGHIHGVGK